ncbi:MAG: hypothetical protein ACC661_07495 [Verrucomicrobiales bacterium]
MNSFPQAAANLVELRSLLRERFPQAHREEVSPTGGSESAPEPGWESGVACLDGLGLEPGHVIEVVRSEPGCAAGHAAGSGLVIHRLLQGAANRGRHVALVDGCDAFDPESACHNTCASLLWVRCRRVTEAVKAADFLLRDGNLPLVLLDLQLSELRELRRVPSSSWYRLKSLAQKVGAFFFAFTPGKLIRSADLRLAPSTRYDLDSLETPRRELGEALRVEVLRRKGSARRGEGGSVEGLRRVG